MQDAANAIGRDDLVIFATAILATQKLVGIPLASVCLKKEANVLLSGYRRNPSLFIVEQASSEVTSQSKRKNVISAFFGKYHTNYVIIAKLAIVAAIAEFISKVVTKGHVSSMITCLILGIIFKGFGFLEDNAMSGANGLAFIYSIPLLSVFSGLTSATPDLVLGQLFPLLVVVILGVCGMIIMSLLMSKIFRWSLSMALAVGSSALFGFPVTLILSNEIANNVGETAEEREYLKTQLQPKMVVAGIITVTLASVFFAGIVANYIR